MAYASTTYHSSFLTVSSEIGARKKNDTPLVLYAIVVVLRHRVKKQTVGGVGHLLCRLLQFASPLSI